MKNKTLIYVFNDAKNIGLNMQHVFEMPNISKGYIILFDFVYKAVPSNHPT